MKEYQAKPLASLNEDQKKALASLPVLEGVLHELEDAKKAIDVRVLNHICTLY